MDKNLELLLGELLARMRAGERLTDRELLRLQRRFPKDSESAQPFFTKAQLLAALEHTTLTMTDRERRQLARALRVKPVRTQSGVATVTLLTKPWPCPGGCIFCPSQAQMPKSYLAREPGAQRAEANYFDPYLQVTNRLETLAAMGHNLDKIEVIILGGTWDAYPESYRIWFVSEVFTALNDFGAHQRRAGERRDFYQQLEATGEDELILSRDAATNHKRFAAVQEQLDHGTLTYNDAVSQLLASQREQTLALRQQASWEALTDQQDRNAASPQRCVGLVIETRPDVINEQRVIAYRRLGCTKIQIGVQSVDDDILARNGRPITSQQIARAIALLRLYGFKIHAHFMANLYGATPQGDQADFARFVTDPAFLPDEIKLYPCALLASAPLVDYYNDGRWRPYTQTELLAVLVTDMLAAPPYVRVSRMIRDFSAQDIVAGNKKTNFRQLVDQELTHLGQRSREIRSREIKTSHLDPSQLRLRETVYDTSVSREYFLEWVTGEDKIVGFLRLSLPDGHQLAALDLADPLGLRPGENAMIREVHVYGTVAPLGQQGSNSQHLGLGKQLIARATAIARAHHRSCLRVIAAVGTRRYYEQLGFTPDGLYHRLDLKLPANSPQVVL